MWSFEVRVGGGGGRWTGVAVSGWVKREVGMGVRIVEYSGCSAVDRGPGFSVDMRCYHCWKSLPAGGDLHTCCKAQDSVMHDACTLVPGTL
jgi:hypothetical protein